MIYDLRVKPNPQECPRRFCFMWQMGRVLRPDTPQPATVQEGCGNPSGVCTRLNPVEGDHDWYETEDHELHEAGLPWFYFIPTPNKLVVDLRESYVRESEALWGEKHWIEREEEAA